MKVLNLYAGIGGNRKLWGDIDVDAIENNPEIAKIYHDNFPYDTIIVTNAHKYLLEYYKNYDFIWSSPPCPSHSRFRLANCDKPQFPNMELYEEIIFLKWFFKGKWIVENVISYYEPLIKPILRGGHYFWSNFPIENNNISKINDAYSSSGKQLCIKLGFNWDGINGFSQYDKRNLFRNCTEPKLGLHIFNCAFKEKQLTINDVKH